MANSQTTQSTSFDRFAALCAILAGVAGFLYSLAFIVISRTNPGTGLTLYSLFQLVGALLVTAALVALYDKVRAVHGAFALWGLILGLVGAAGSLIHGGYDLANAINPPSANPLASADLPSQIDPRGLLTFGVAGLSVLAFSCLITRTGQLPKALGYLGYALGVLLLALYVGRLVILQATNPVIVVPALLTGFLVNPTWYVWLGLALLRTARPR